MRFVVIFLFLFVITVGNALRCIRQAKNMKQEQECSKAETKCLTFITKNSGVLKYCAKSSECVTTKFTALPSEKVTCCDTDLCNK
ncbi:xenoxin-1-like [Xenopus tropicalis]|uniref:Xenoxin-1-like n=1 Tax=Xenopus tropicalis TaxID=8364 RepID=A0A8J1IWU3_XENTR|nr:xenoxin-1-like [Xenopus tropicalis]